MFSGKFPEQCLISHSRCLRVFFLPWKGGFIPYPSPNMLHVFVRIGPKPLWDYSGRGYCRELRGDVRIVNLESGGDGSIGAYPGNPRGHL